MRSECTPAETETANAPPRNGPDAPKLGRTALRTSLVVNPLLSKPPAITLENHKCDASAETTPAVANRVRNSQREVERGRRSESACERAAKVAPEKEKRAIELKPRWVRV